MICVAHGRTRARRGHGASEEREGAEEEEGRGGQSHAGTDQGPGTGIGASLLDVCVTN